MKELAVPALLRPLAPPDLLDLVAPERELQVAGVLEDVARKRDRQVKVQAEPRVSVAVGGLHPPQDVDLLVDLAFASQLIERLNRARLDGCEPMQLERPAKDVQHVLFDEPLRGQILRKPGERGRACHRSHSSGWVGAVRVVSRG